MKRSFYLGAILALSIGYTGAATPPAEQLLPSDTLAVLTVRDWDQAEAAYARSPQGRLWSDPDMKAVKEKFLNKFQTEVVTPLERELGVKFSDYTNLVHGQFTLALTPNGWQGEKGQNPGWVLILDAKDRSEALKAALAGVRKKWVDAGKSIKTTKIRDVEFTTLMFNAADVGQALGKAFKNGKPTNPGGADQKSTPVEITVGQSGSLLLAGNVASDLEKVLILQSGGLVPKLADQPLFAAHQGIFRDALALGWVNFRPFIEIINKKAAAAPSNPSSPMSLRPEKIIAALGLDGLQTLAGSYTESPEGSLAHVFLSVPEAKRKGLFQILATGPQAANPPPFVPADAVKFSRWRLDCQKAWGTIETTVNEISPQLSGLLQTTLGAVGKDKDPNFDLKKSLIGNLGDDLISYQKAPTGRTLAALNAPPSVFLVGSPNAEQLAHALQIGLSLISPNVKDREFLGRRIYSLQLPTRPGAGGASGTARSLSFAASGGYVALSSNEGMVEDFLRSSGTPPKSLAGTPGLPEAAQNVGGMQTGFFGYDNQTQTMRVLVEALKENSQLLDQVFSLHLGPHQPGGTAAAPHLSDWIDFSLVPPFDKIAKYFSFVVYGLSTTSDGFSLKLFSPTPPQLRQ